jgi:hypothetical protein
MEGAVRHKKNPPIKMSGLKFIKYNRPKLSIGGPVTCRPCLIIGQMDIGSGTGERFQLTAAHTITAIQTFIAGSAADGNMSAGITGGRIALHAFGGCIDGINTCFCFFNSGFYWF